jgi:hypothetical protein
LARFDPESMLRVLADQRVDYVLIDGLAATLHGSPLRTGDADICPASTPENLERLATALRGMGARIRSADAPDGMAFTCDATFLRNAEILNLTTRFGDLDVCFRPAGIAGYDELRRNVVELALDDLVIPVAALADVIRSKETANRPRDRAMLPTLRALLERSRRGP